METEKTTVDVHLSLKQDVHTHSDSDKNEPSDGGIPRPHIHKGSVLSGTQCYQALWAAIREKLTETQTTPLNREKRKMADLLFDSALGLVHCWTGSETWPQIRCVDVHFQKL